MKRNFIKCLIVVVPLLLYCAAAFGLGSEPAKQGIELRIRCIAPNIRVMEVDGYDILCSQLEFELLKTIEEIRPKTSLCLISVELTNNSDNSYLLSDWDLRTMFTRSMVLVDDKDSRWKINDTFRTIDAGNPVYNIPCVKGTSRTFTFTVGLSKMVHEDGSHIDAAHLPKSVKYSSEAPFVVGCRGIHGTALAEPATLCILLSEGECAVSETGCP